MKFHFYVKIRKPSVPSESPHIQWSLEGPASWELDHGVEDLDTSIRFPIIFSSSYGDWRWISWCSEISSELTLLPLWSEASTNTGVSNLDRQTSTSGGLETFTPCSKLSVENLRRWIIMRHVNIPIDAWKGPIENQGIGDRGITIKLVITSRTVINAKYATFSWTMTPASNMLFLKSLCFDDKVIALYMTNPSKMISKAVAGSHCAHWTAPFVPLMGGHPGKGSVM